MLHFRKYEINASSIISRDIINQSQRMEQAVNDMINTQDYEPKLCLQMLLKAVFKHKYAHKHNLSCIYDGYGEIIFLHMRGYTEIHNPSRKQLITDVKKILKVTMLVINMIPLSNTIHTDCLICFNFDFFLVWLTCCDIRVFVIANNIGSFDVTNDLQSPIYLHWDFRNF